MHRRAGRDRTARSQRSRALLTPTVTWGCVCCGGCDDYADQPRHHHVRAHPVSRLPAVIAAVSQVTQRAMSMGCCVSVVKLDCRASTPAVAVCLRSSMLCPVCRCNVRKDEIVYLPGSARVAGDGSNKAAGGVVRAAADPETQWRMSTKIERLVTELLQIVAYNDAHRAASGVVVDGVAPVTGMAGFTRAVPAVSSDSDATDTDSDVENRVEGHAVAVPESGAGAGAGVGAGGEAAAATGGGGSGNGGCVSTDGRKRGRTRRREQLRKRARVASSPSSLALPPCLDGLDMAAPVKVLIISQVWCTAAVRIGRCQWGLLQRWLTGGACIRVCVCSGRTCWI